MSLHPQPISPVPAQTARVAQAAFPHGNTYLMLRDELGTLFTDEDFTDLYPTHGQPAAAPWRLALVTVLQFVENLSDRKAAEAVRGRIDWKYALGLELDDPAFDSTVLSEFRSRLIDGSAEHRLLDALLNVCRKRNWLKVRGRQRTDSTHVLGRIRALNRLQCVGETFRQALNAIALVDPQWFLAHADPEWVDRYGRRFDDNRLSTGRPESQDSAQQVGADGYALLEAISHPQTPAWLTSLPAIQTLQQVWRQQFLVEAGKVRWRTVQEGIPPSSLFISSPYDTEARYAKKRSTSWVGYKVHLTESCEESAPHLIVHVETTPSPVADGAVTPAIHQTLQDKDLLPEKHLVDTGYLDAHLLVQSQQKYDVDLVGPTRADYRWQARADEGFAASEFPIDWEARQATCPAGHTSISWTPAVDRGHQTVIKIKFSSRDCRVCPSHHQCTKAKRRTITIRSREEYEALNAARLREETEEFRREYDRRAGIEGTVSQGVRVCGLRRSRYVGEAKTHLQHVATATAMNLLRISSWLMDRPRETTRTPPFVKVMQMSLAG